ncbi:Narbonolide/10-deoxymethynolide synthase PikA2, modules 3 and 4 [Streptomyces sp. RB5]|uniref:Narbonolide/10-deoxymethynolide synthase PikA2, modules 3 and 4 n=1 Tax=Streptomyces smaragdinus TaxID=2585196 RepID=A0A7K0CRM9_9ACTN|nr:NADP-dependent oxidoreductase [Streptomyces smaragdinus]MQY16147.1 Narbonolide/10-deoxymethynolide synthase PikA2, modules 3 and 4 [Streptomyces smaragdinus]
MKAIVLHQYGTADDLQLTDLPEPKVGPGEVLVRVKAAGVNPVDWKLAAGRLDPVMEAAFPFIPGWDVAGVVERVGLDADDFAPGDEVYGYVRKDWAQMGTYAELVTANVRHLARKPRTLSWEQAAGVPLAGLTAYQSIERVGLTKDDTVLIHAAAGGVGSAAVQIAAALGARVIGTASERNHDYLRALGAEPVTYGEGLADRVRALAPDGMDAALDYVGGDAVDISLALLKDDKSRVASITDASAKEKGGHYVWVRPDSSDLTALTQLADEGRFTVHVDRALPLERAAEAWRLSESGRVRGKVVLTV